MTLFRIRRREPGDDAGAYVQAWVWVSDEEVS